MKNLVLCAAAAALCAACEPSRQMQIRDGLHPASIDKSVRFRTTYYFRSFDWCYSKNIINADSRSNRSADPAESLILPETDTLYRFRMTGKANPLTSQIKFESGTLSASEIDPFGSKIKYDENIDGFRFISRDEVDALAKRAEVKQDFKELINVLEDINALEVDADQKKDLEKQILAAIAANLSTQTGGEINSNYSAQKPASNDAEPQQPAGGPSEPPAARSDGKSRNISEADRSALKALTQTQMADLSDPRFTIATLEGLSVVEIQALVRQNFSRRDYERAAITLGTTPDRLIETIEERGKEDPDVVQSLAQGVRNGLLGRRSGVDRLDCDGDLPVRRGFQIMGPEGWRTFNQDERLIMAMTSSDKPLINLMKEYSDRILESKAASPQQDLVLTREHLKLTNAERAFDRAELTEETANAAFKTAIEEFKSDD